MPAGRHWGYFKQTLGHGSSAVNLAQGLTTGIGYATGKDMSGTTAMLNSAGAIIDDNKDNNTAAKCVSIYEIWIYTAYNLSIYYLKNQINIRYYYKY